MQALRPLRALLSWSPRLHHPLDDATCHRDRRRTRCWRLRAAASRTRSHRTASPWPHSGHRGSFAPTLSSVPDCGHFKAVTKASKLADEILFDMPPPLVRSASDGPSAWPKTSVLGEAVELIYESLGNSLWSFSCPSRGLRTHKPLTSQIIMAASSMPIKINGRRLQHKE
jgi:hypothetical protein